MSTVRKICVPILILCGLGAIHVRTDAQADIPKGWSVPKDFVACFLTKGLPIGFSFDDPRQPNPGKRTWILDLYKRVFYAIKPNYTADIFYVRTKTNLKGVNGTLVDDGSNLEVFIPDKGSANMRLMGHNKGTPWRQGPNIKLLAGDPAPGVSPGLPRDFSFEAPSSPTLGERTWILDAHTGTFYEFLPLPHNTVGVRYVRKRVKFGDSNGTLVDDGNNFEVFIPDKDSPDVAMRWHNVGMPWGQGPKIYGAVSPRLPDIFSFDYPYQPTPGKRTWILDRDMNVYYELMPDHSMTIRFIKDWIKLGDSNGTLVDDGNNFEVFIPDKGSTNMRLQWHNKGTPWGQGMILTVH